MFRYLAFVWDDEDRPQTHAANSLVSRLQASAGPWNDALHVPGMHVFYSGARPGSSEVHRLNGVAGVLLGTVFEACTEQSESSLPKKRFPEGECRQIIATGCRSLIGSCWGRYVAFARDAAIRRSYVLRDPTGGIPCYRASFRGVDVYFSCVEDIVRLDIVQVSVNWNYIAARVAFAFLHGRETALNDITEVMAGEHIEIGGGTVARSFAWNALSIAQADILEHADVAARELRRVARVCIHSWAACYRHVLHKLSGGLDSSIVLACLHDAPAHPTITCLNYYSPESNGDERAFAHLAATRADVPLLERERDGAVRLADLSHMARSVAPTFYLGPLQTSRPEALLAHEIGATAYFGGAGGDQLFYQAQGILTAADYLHLHGLDRRFIEVALDAAHLEHCSIWHVVREAYARKRTSPPWNLRAKSAALHRLVSDRAISRALEHGGFTHPLFDAVSSLPPGKLWHAYGLTVPLEFYDPLGAPDDPEQVQPLTSQPLVELCLRIPTYVLTNSGWDRALARQAFRTDVPKEILRRRSKGGMEEHANEIIARNRATARELLLDGHLAQAGMLERSRVDEVLSDRPTPIAGAAAEIFDHLGVEIWLRRWNSDAG